MERSIVKRQKDLYTVADLGIRRVSRAARGLALLTGDPGGVFLGILPSNKDLMRQCNEQIY
jgi:hypothetical protein